MKFLSFFHRQAPACAAVLCLGLICGAASAAETHATGQMKSIDIHSRQNNPVAPTSKALELSKKSDGCPKVPDGITPVYYSSMSFSGKTIWFVLGKSDKSKSSLDRLAVDLNGDGTLSKDEVKDLRVQSGTARSGQPYARGMLLGTSFATKNGEYPFFFEYIAYPITATPHASLISLSYLEAPVTVDGSKYVVDVSDANVNGTFDDDADTWTIHAAGTTTFQPTPGSGQDLGDGHFFDGHRFVVNVDKDMTIHVSATKAKGPDPKDLQAKRERVEKRWASRFDKERARFVKAKNVDTSRPKAKTPIHWNYVTFDKALAMAKRENKPLFVDVMAFWCIWCYRMDYYTYPDAAVAKILNHDFIPVKVIQEQNESDYRLLMQKMGARGIPAMGVWDSKGNLDDTLSGWKKPADFVVALESALKKVAAANAPKKTGANGSDGAGK